MCPEYLQNDTLTGLLTRRAFAERLHNFLDEARKTERPATFVFTDIDNFLELHETLGHQAGDGMLAAVAGLARQVFGEQAILGRYGGDEFALLLPDIEREMALLTFERLRQAVEAQTSYEYEGRQWEWKITLSAGILAGAPT